MDNSYCLVLRQRVITGGARFVLSGEQLLYSCLFALLIFGIAPQDCYGRKSFVVYDATLYSDKPDLRRFGVRPLHIAYEPNLFDERIRERRPADAMPTDKRLRIQADEARRISSDYTIIDIESWTVHNSRHYEREAATNITRLANVLAQFRRIAPDQKVGLFGPLPVISGYERLGAIMDHKMYADMQRDNNNVTPLFNLVDAVFPIGYTFTDKFEEWRASLIVQISEIKRIKPGIPVLLFLWPRYADYGPIPDGIKFRPLEREYWRYQLETAYELVDGIVIWGGWGSDNKRERWDSTALWWNELEIFLGERQLLPPLSQ